MLGIEITHVNHAMMHSCRESGEIDPSWSRVDIAESQLPITHSDLKKLERHDIIGRAAQEQVGDGGVKWSIFRNMIAYKSFLNDYDVWVVATYVCFERSELWVSLDFTGIPRDDVKLHSVIEVCLWVDGRPVGTMASRQRCCEACVVMAP